ncbi:hypothetical protein ASF14_19980 [Sphingomonas sp. Leaf257]|nr:hypothetical protein ASF14_19980 [Sphingomonas sp. Leaf257]
MRVTNSGVTVDVAAGAVVSNGAAPAIAFDYSGRGIDANATLTVGGQVLGNGQTGVQVTGSSTNSVIAPTLLTMTVRAGGSVSGANGVVLTQSGTGSTTSAAIDNSGTISATGPTGYALQAATPASVFFSSVTNRAGGSIGAISGTIGTLGNAGTIDGGALSAIDFTATTNTSVTRSVLNSSGTITTNGTSATLANIRSTTLTNSGTIRNTGSGAAIAGRSLTLVNAAGGQISTAGTGADAITLDGNLILTNRGTITGNVVTSTGTSRLGSSIDNSEGQIAGRLTLNSGNDTLVVGYADGQIRTGVTGAISTRSGNNVLRVRFTGDATLADALPRQAGFEQTVLAPDANRTVTLASGFSTVNPATGTADVLNVAGNGTLVNNATLGRDGVVLSDSATATQNTLSIVNAGTINGTGGTNVYAVQINAASSFQNSGQITGAANGVQFATAGGTFANSGTIAANGNAVSSAGTGFANSGTIRSDAGLGLTLSGTTTTGATNSGRIQGATVGVQLASGLTNSGTIGATGTGVDLGSTGVIVNQTGGTISGATAIVSSASTTNAVSAVQLANAGTITGDVRFGTGSSASRNLYQALPGGVLNGNLTLNTGDSFVTELGGNGAGGYAGVSGAVSGRGATLLYRVRTDTNSAVMDDAAFAGFGYDLLNNATLNLTGTASGRTIQLAGQGVVNLTTNIAAANSAAIVTTTRVAQPGEDSPANALSVVNQAALSLTATAGSGNPRAAVQLGGTDAFENATAATITVLDQRTNAATPMAGVTGGRITNNGLIAQGGGSAAVTGVADFASLVNNGTIQVGGSAVVLGSNTVATSSTVDNSGRIASTGGPAITQGSLNVATIRNLAGGTITGAAGQPVIRVDSVRLANAGTITGDVDLGYAANGGRSTRSSSYVANGGTITGNLRFGDGDDVLVTFDGQTGVTGTIDAGGGTNTYRRAFARSATVTVGDTNVRSFQLEDVQAVGADTVLTLQAPGTRATLNAVGDGQIVNTIGVTGLLTFGERTDRWNLILTPLPLAAFTNQATITGRVEGTATRFVNMATIGTADQAQTAARIYTAAFENMGTILNGGRAPAAFGTTDGATLVASNSGTIDARGVAGVGLRLGFEGSAGAFTRTVALTNTGTIRADGGGTGNGSSVLSERVAIGLNLTSNSQSAQNATVVNAETGVIEAIGAQSTAILAQNVALDLTNAGTIRGGAGTALSVNDPLAGTIGSSYLAGAIQSIGGTNDRIVNTGTILGSIALGSGSDRIENYGRIEGDVFLGAGADTFLHRIGATLVGTVDGGDGADNLTIDAIANGTVNAGQFVNFESLTQSGIGNVDYVGNLRFDTIRVSGGSMTIGAGATVTGSAGSTTGLVTIIGGDNSDTVTNNGTIAGDVRLGGGADRFVNGGIVQGSVLLGGGNDTFVEAAGSQVTGTVDGGSGTNTYTVQLSGDRSGIGQRSNFQQLAVTGTGTLSLTLDQGFNSIALAGTGLNLTLAGNRVASVAGSDAAEQLRIDEDIVSIALGAGDDVLVLDMAQALGRYDGGTGTDTLRFGSTAPVTLGGTATGFETVALAGNALTVTGTLGSANAPLSFGDGNLALTIASGGRLIGAIDLGAGNDTLRLAAGSVLQGSVTGGAGNDTAILEMAGNQTLAGTLTGFETLATEGTGILSLTGAHAYGQVLAATDLSIAAGGSLTTDQLVFTGADQRFTIAGLFAGAVDGGAGTDTITLSGGSATTPVAFTSVANVEGLAMTGGYATVSGKAAFGNVDMAGGRLVGLAGSTMSAAQFLVRQGATFGSAGTVNGNVVVAGTLSPGASPGTMTVNGNLTLASGSITAFELTPTISDQLIVNGTMTIGSASTLQITSTKTIAPGSAYDLIIATGGISGSYTTVQKPSDLLGFIVQRGDRIQLLGQFVGGTQFNPQVARSIDYANRVIASAPTNSPVFAAFPALLTSAGAPNPQAFAQVTPEAYASAMQIGVDNALGLVQAARGPGFATMEEEAGAFTFGQMIGQSHQLSADAAQGINAARTSGYGILGGIGLGNRDWMVGFFGGYLDSRQTIETLGASTHADGVVAGLHARFRQPGGFGMQGSLIYDGAQGRTTRALPGATSALGSYDLHSTTADISAHYTREMKGGWTLTPRAGLTYMRTMRLGFTETGSPFALTLGRQALTASFVDAGVSLERSTLSDAALRPFGTLGLRYQLQGAKTQATGGYGGIDATLLALGVSRAPLVGTATAGLSYRVAYGVDVYASGSALIGSGDRQGTAMAGLRLAF